MNIEEERKAFDTAMIKALADKTCAKYGEHCRANAEKHGMQYIVALDDDREPLFTAWLAAKAHAAEMAKPVVKLRGFGINPFEGSATFYVAGGEHFQFKLHTIGPMGRKEAVQWCVERGYRVIE